VSQPLSSLGDLFEPLLSSSEEAAGPRRDTSGWLLAICFALAGSGIAVAAIIAAPPRDSIRPLLFLAALILAAGIAGGQLIKLDQRTVQPAPTLVFVVCAAILLGPAAAIVVGLVAALATSRSPLPSLVFHLALAALTGASSGLVATELAARAPHMNIMVAIALVATSGVATWTAGEFVVLRVRNMASAFRKWALAAESIELLVAVAFSPALVTLYRSAGVEAASVLATVIVLMFVAFRVYRDRLLRLHAEITHMSRTDPLTGSGNRRAFDERLEQELARGTRNDRQVGLLLIDVDHFKEINDSHGHESGDRVLKELCERLSSRLRREDLLARIGGDEFAAIITDLADQHDLREVADALCQAVRERTISTTDGMLLKVTVCIGGAASDWWRDPDDLRRVADEALYAAKTQGRDRAVIALGEEH